MKKQLLVLTVGILCLSIFIVARRYFTPAPTLTMLENQFSADRDNGLQVFELKNPADYPMIMEVKCENVLSGAQMDEPGLGLLEPGDRILFPIILDATKVGTERPVKAQCYIKKWVRWI